MNRLLIFLFFCFVYNDKNAGNKRQQKATRSATEKSAQACYHCVTKAARTFVYLTSSMRKTECKTAPLPISCLITTIPRLELLSALLLSKLIVTVSRSLQPTLPQLKVQCYTDLEIALYWIRGVNKEWKPFVRNRVNEIRRNVHPSLWSHCPGVSNPADLPSRGLNTLELAVSQLWRQGPHWLHADAPWTDPEPTCMPEECAAELKATASHNLMSTSSQGSIDNLLSCDRFNTLPRLLRVTAHVMRAVRRFRGSRGACSSYFDSRRVCLC